ncbi:SusC/RagA family TonB-linked outer membrane protein [Chryseolinea lacunae]|uniref:TonB-dependent receptor n=1 Tax=Chryseolinea lacunae TaxID=2801331 RepID=A0ABS1L2R2_9BACT|nr:TonB-dependent receptor [Chryseolinea lacunae]MBL0745797.1 TonB-dependent receptor [Chryseolinea lacunae]
MKQVYQTKSSLHSKRYSKIFPFLFCFLVAVFFDAVEGLSSATGLKRPTTHAGMKSFQAPVKGVVKDETGQPLPGASVLEKGTSNGTQADMNGAFSLTLLSPEATLVISYIGYENVELPASPGKEFAISLQPNATALGDIVVIGYGTTTKKNLVSSVASVSAEELKNQPVARLDQALQGRAAGVQVTSNSGAPGAAATIRIRGSSSLSGNNNPLFVIDGFIAGEGFNLNSLNMNDIESIQVLKDATALSIYGTRGAAGVIIVTTKSGNGARSDGVNVGFNYYQSVQSLINTVRPLNGQAYLDYKNEEAQFVPGTSGFGETDRNLPIPFPAGKEYPNTDWLEAISRTGTISNADLFLSGNAERVKYYVSFNRFKQNGVIQNSGLERYLFRTNLDFKISEKVRTGLRMNLSRVRTENPKVDFYSAMFRALPIRPIYNPDGSYNGVNPESARTERNPVADINMREDYGQEGKNIGNVYVEYEPLKHLIFKSSFGVELTNNRNNQYLPGQLPDRKISSLGGLATVTQDRSDNYLNENTLTYKREFGSHILTVLGGATWQKYTIETTSMMAGGFVNDAVGVNNISFGSDPATYQLSSNFVQRTFSSLLSRIDYSFKNKYLLTLVGRRDGSSVFQEGNKYAFFPSLGAAWNLDQERFLQNSKIVSALKLRSSYGLVGEQGVRPYNSIATLARTNTYFNEKLLNGVVIGELPSSNLTWETTKQLDIGLELGLFNNRIRIEADYYNKKTEDLLLERKVAGTVGSTRLQNIGSMENRGLELSLYTVNLEKSNFSWETTLTVSANRNKIIDLGGAPFIDLRTPPSDLVATGTSGTGIRLMPGQVSPTFVGVEYLGTYKNAEEIVADGMKGVAFIGGPRYKDQDGNGVIDNGDKIPVGNPQPDFYGGFRNLLKYKGLSLDFFFQFSVGNKIFNAANSSAIFGRGDENLSPDIVNRWIEGVNETSNIPRAGTSANIWNPVSTLWIEDGSFLRLRTVTLSYELPMVGLGIDGVFKRINVYVSGTNLWLLSNYSLGDPEVNNYGGSALEQGVASGQYPYTKSFTAGLSVEF